MRRDPLRNPEPLVRRVYAYVAYRLGDRSEADDVTSDVFERALRYRESYDPERGEPLGWLFGIARRCVAAAARAKAEAGPVSEDLAAPGDLESEVVDRLALEAALSRLSERDQELVALRYGADLKVRQVAEILELTTNATEVALHRALSRLRAELVEPAAPLLAACATGPVEGAGGVRVSVPPR